MISPLWSPAPEASKFVKIQSSNRRSYWPQAGLRFFFCFAPLAVGVLSNPTRAADLAPENDPYCTISPEALKFVSPGTRKMASLLEKLAQNANPAANNFLNSQRAAMLRADLSKSTNPSEAVQIRWQMARELLNAGKTLESMAELDEIERIRANNPTDLGSRFLALLRGGQALAHLRLGEQENCLLNHTSKSCILPIAPEGVHQLKQGSRKAIEVLEGQLKRTPNDRKLAWLLNIAHMTLGQYPAGVPQEWLISPHAFASDFDIKPFPDVAAHLGLDVNDFAGGTVTEDFDGDGDIDLMISDWSLRGPLRYFVNNGDGTFTDKTMLAGLSGLIGSLSLIQGDYNNDGLPDVLALRGAWLFTEGQLPDSLLRNDGNGHFTDVTEEAGLLAFCPNQTAVWLDYNADGWLDLYFGYESFGDNTFPSKLFRNNRDGTFTECAAAAGVAVVGFVKAVVSGDYNNDGRPDLYLSRRGQPNVLLRNDGPRSSGGDWRAEWKFTDVSVFSGVTEPISSFPAGFFDFNNDGWEDIFVTGYSIKDSGDIAAEYLGKPHSAEKMRLYQNNRDGTFKDVSQEFKVDKLVHAMGCNFGDFDNDGWLDLYLATGDPDLATLIPNRAFRNAGGKFFQDVTTSGGFGHLQKGHGVSFADLDQDGDQDIYHSVGGAYEGDNYRNVLFENPGHGNNWISLKLVGMQSNKAAIGARLKLLVDDGGTEREIHRTVGTGASFGANPLMQHIGVGKAARVKTLEIFWPATGKTQTVSDLEARRGYLITESGEHTDLHLPSFQFSRTPPKPHEHHPVPGQKS